VIGLGLGKGLGIEVGLGLGLGLGFGVGLELVWDRDMVTARVTFRVEKENACHKLEIYNPLKSGSRVRMWVQQGSVNASFQLLDNDKTS
jgi:hypothetical protein